MYRVTLPFLAAFVPIIAGCAVQRAVVASDAQQKMIGLSKEESPQLYGTASREGGGRSD